MKQIRVVTAASLFDGHDATINIIRRILQSSGCEVIHLGHNRSVKDIVICAIQEGAQAICVSSYQGGHIAYFKYMKDLLKEFGAPYIKVFGGGGGVIIHEEKNELESYGVDYIFHPEDGRKMGLQGMIDIITQKSQKSILEFEVQKSTERNTEEFNLYLGRALSEIELKGKTLGSGLEKYIKNKNPLILGITGTGGAGKSSLVDELLQRLLNSWPEIKIGVLCVDPTKKKTGGALLGDRIRMNSLSRGGIFMRSLASQKSNNEISEKLPLFLNFCKTLDFDLLIAETSGIGQSSSAITEIADLSVYVMTSEYGASSQLEKIDMIDLADFIVINKSDRRGAKDALRDVKKQYKRSHKLFDHDKEDKLPVYLTQSSQFNNFGVHDFFYNLCNKIKEKKDSIEKVFWNLNKNYLSQITTPAPQLIVPLERQNYLAEIVGIIRNYKSNTKDKSKLISRLQMLENSKKLVPLAEKEIQKEIDKLKKNISKEDLNLLEEFKLKKESYSKSEFNYEVRGKNIKQNLTEKSLSGLDIKRVTYPKFKLWGDQFEFLKLENAPGEFPYTAGVFPLKRKEEEPQRMFAGEGPPERTNKRFHYLSQNSEVKRLSTAFDSVTLYGEDPDSRPDIYGKVGESGVSICTFEDMKRLYNGFDLVNPKTSVSMTINGPAPMILAYFFNTAIDQQVEKNEKDLGRKLNAKEYEAVKSFALSQVRGTVQADILKEDQAQNTCIFSTDFALKMMGDIQLYFGQNNIRNFYSVSISGYHIAEAGANPISQLAFTLSNGFTFVEYYKSRGMSVDEFAPNLSFFFSNGLDPEYTVIGRVARRIWAIAMKEIYKGNERSQKLKYHIQTSGRSLHAQEMSFNDIRTTLQALLAISDHCNSLHTNAYDEAITTPTEESVRRAMAIQMIINREMGLNKSENFLQGSYFVEELTDMVEEAVLEEFLKMNERGGVLGAMETQYQRSQIQEESLFYEGQKHSGELPIVGVNTFIDPKTLKNDYIPEKITLIRATPDEKKLQLTRVKKYIEDHKSASEIEIKKLQEAARLGKNIFEALMSASRVCTLGQMTKALYEIGGQYRRSL